MKKSELVAIIKVNVADKQHNLEVFEDSKARVAAKKFCVAHRLAVPVQESLVNLIEETLDDYRQEKQFYSDPRNRGNIGAALYFKGLKMQNKSRQRLEKQREEQASKSQSELTFKPALNQNSLKLLRRKSQAVAAACPQPVAPPTPSAAETHEFPVVLHALGLRAGYVEAAKATELPAEVAEVLQPFLEKLNEAERLPRKDLAEFIKGLTKESRNVLKKFEAAVYERQTLNKRKTEERLNSLREEKAIREMSECSFRPVLIARPVKKSKGY